MNQPASSLKINLATHVLTQYGPALRCFFAGLLIPFGFAPFHLPGLTILGIALFFAQLQGLSLKEAFIAGFIFGLAYLGFGISWIYVSIRVYGHIAPLLSALITLLFVIYLALFLAGVAAAYCKLATRCSLGWACLLFSALWCLGEYLRSTLLGGFPWLLIGFGQVDTPLRTLLPLIGIYGVGFLTCLSATALTASILSIKMKRYLWMLLFVGILLAPSLFLHRLWTNVNPKPLSVGVIQANLSMRDKWDESLFWELMKSYKHGFDKLLGKMKLIVLPESAIPLPANYIGDFLSTLHSKAKQANSSIVLGIPQSTDSNETYYNSLMTLGNAEGSYSKQHLVPFSEFTPHLFEHLLHWLDVPISNLVAGNNHQPLINVQHHPIASLICYELAYPQLLRHQLPAAEWIISVSDDGWFGHSLAIYQHLQIAQALSLQTGRYQVVANNNGLSSIIDTQGNITASLPAFQSDLLKATLHPATGSTPWVNLGDYPILALCLFSVFAIPIAANRKRRYPYQPI